MKKTLYSALLLPFVLISTSFTRSEITPAELKDTKWISPVDDNCFDSLCFNSESTVVMYRCETGNTYFEIGYKINGDNIEIEAYSHSDRKIATKMVLYMDDGILRMRDKDQNYFAKNYIKMSNGSCN